MKIIVPKDTNQGKAGFKKPLLPLVPDPSLFQIEKGKSMEFMLRTDPADQDCAKFKMSARILHGDESIRAVILWKRDLIQVEEGLNATTYDEKCRIARTLMRGTALGLFENKLTSLKTEAYDTAMANAADAAARNAVAAQGINHYVDVAHHDPAIRWVMENVMPHHCLAKIKRFLRRECRKPTDMKVKTFYHHLISINNDELEELPPFNPNQVLTADELLDIILFAVPKSWLRELDRQGKDPYTMTVQEVVDFLEQIEASEDFEGERVTKEVADSKPAAKKKNGNGNNKNNSGGQKYCMLHGKGSHTTEDCRTVKAQVKKTKLEVNNGEKSYASKNKTWKKKAYDDKKKSQKELNVMTKKFLKLKKEVNSLNKKRKSDSDDDSDAMELHAIEKELNALDMNDFSIEDLKASMKASGDDDEISV